MAGYIKAVSVLFLVLSVVLKVSAGNTSACYQQVCRECSDKAVQENWQEKRCEFRSLVSLTLLDAPDRPGPPTNEVPVDYACLKLTASNPDIIGDSTDVIRGCTLAMTGESMCRMLVGEEQSRGKKNVRCHICYGDLCNGALGLTTAPAAFILLAVASIKAMLY